MRLTILDRDGVINHDSEDFIKSPAEWYPISGSLEAIARLNQAGYRVVIATNQSGLERGLLTLDDLHQIHAKMMRQLADVGGYIEAIFFCPHGPKSHCTCRKPEPGLLYDIAHRLGVPLTGVPFIGDALRDLQAATTTGAQPILVLTGKGTETVKHLHNFAQVPVYADLATAVDNLIKS